jgi:uncharacterized protein YqfA (UPF0365 family)
MEPATEFLIIVAVYQIILFIAWSWILFMLWKIRLESGVNVAGVDPVKGDQ